MGRTFAIGDTHGCNDALQQMLFEKIRVTREDAIYCLGDYIDRGPDSKGVADTLLDLRGKGYHIHTLRGNHEELMMQSVQDIESFSLWYANGGDATLESFGVDRYSELDEKYRDFFEQTELYIATEKYIFVHAGLNFSNSDIFEDTHAMLWIRDLPAVQPALGDRLLIHGHTPQPLDKLLGQKGNCINIDGGCVYTDRKNMGYLVAIELPSAEFLIVSNR